MTAFLSGVRGTRTTARRSAALVATIAAMVFGASSVQAHHSTAAYDYTKKVTLNGTVRQFLWTNPHMFVKLTAPFNNRPTVWNIEAGTPNINVRHGWKETDLKAGDKVVVEIAPLRDGSAGGTLISVKLPDGRTLWGPAVDIRNAPRPN